MINGVISTRQILFHPILMIHQYGFLNFLSLLVKGLSRRTYQLLPLLFALKKPR